MSRIALLPEEVASQVAAGEVVERPASVVKELVENSLDAQATRIEVMIRRGGISSIRVVDNGIGMDRDDALLCLERHATSKIRSGHDLAAISTLGFRGEALPSIASVSRFRLATRPHDALAGTEVLVAGGRIETVRDGGEAPGTQVEVRSLFYNLPARRKFLRTENTEASHVEHQLHLQAIGHPGTGFVFLQDERLIYQLPPTLHLRERIRDLCGPALAAELLEIVPADGSGIKIWGFLGKSGVSRSTRQQQLVFLNGRAVENSTLSYALREGYHTALMKGQHPVTFLFMEMDPAAVDVNVHPAKREVRFRDSAAVREAVVEAVRRTLESDRASWTQTFMPGPSPTRSINAAGPFAATRAPDSEQGRFDLPQGQVVDFQWTRPAAASLVDLAPGAGSVPVDGQPPAQAPDIAAVVGAVPNEPVPSFPLPSPDSAQGLGTEGQFRILGVLGKLYVLMENAEGLVLVDQHAAHERILFEQMRKRMEEQGVPAQRLLMPITLQVPPRDSDWLMRHLDLLERVGIGLEPFGSGTFKIDALPTFLKGREPGQLIREIIDDLRETSSQSSRLRLGEEMIAKTVCRHAVKANDYLREAELVRLIEDLLACELPYCCPHGRPTMIQMNYGELEKKFGRKV